MTTGRNSFDLWSRSDGVYHALSCVPCLCVYQSTIDVQLSEIVCIIIWWCVTFIIIAQIIIYFHPLAELRCSGWTA